MAFTPRLNTDGMNNNPWWYSNGNPFYDTPGHVYGMPNCTCYAYGRYAEIRNSFATLPVGDAGTWFNDATTFPRGQLPKLGAIVCYGGSSTNPGHVAVVEEIHPDGSITTSNSGYGGPYFWTETVSQSSNYTPTWCTNRGYSLQGFIYNDAVLSVSPYVVAAICGNFKQESNVNPGIWEQLTPPLVNGEIDWAHMYDGIGGFGLGQWTNTSASNMRCLNLHNWVTSNGFADGDGNGQLAFLIHENYWANASQTLGNYNTLEEFLNSDSTNLYNLTHDFLINWEGIGTQTLNDRYTAAQDFYDYIVRHMSDDPNNYSWISTNQYLSWDDMRNNVMCAYFWLNSNAPTPVKKRRGMPLWMLLRYLP